MKTLDELNHEILKITEIIRKQFPELAIHIGEMPVKIFYNDGEDPNINNLQGYYNSLETLLNKYSINHKT